MITEELQLASAMCPGQFFKKSPAKQAGENADRQEQAHLAGHPMFAICRETTTGNDAVDVRMTGQCRSEAGSISVTPICAPRCRGSAVNVRRVSAATSNNSR